MKNRTSLRVCIILPAFNEGKVITKIAAGAIKALEASPYSGEVVVVNDGSKDNTSDAARKGGARVIDHVLNTGQGGAVATGLSYAEQNGFDIGVTMDADGQHDIKDVFRGIDELVKRDSDLLIGSRLIDSKGMSKVKVLGNKGLSFITYALFGINSTDSQSGLRIFSRRALEQLRWKTSGYEFCSEMLWRAKQLGLKVGEYPIKAIYTDYSVSRGQNNWNGINIVKSLIRRRIVEIFE
ncbi:MAG TPA: glycosyltransferase family 2 protein [Candidatus Saccharimonadales bacterium]|nr:glycosyltransferase family 2 protein [Candidatus Saccharimonadales bacterium]